jgi:hypothetical protein
MIGRPFPWLLRQIQIHRVDLPEVITIQPDDSLELSEIWSTGTEDEQHGLRELGRGGTQELGRRRARTSRTEVVTDALPAKQQMEGQCQWSGDCP